MRDLKLYRDRKNMGDGIIRSASTLDEDIPNWRKLIMALIVYSVDAVCPYCLQEGVCRLRIARLQDGREARDLCCSLCVVGHGERLERGRMMLTPEELAEEREELDGVWSSSMADVLAAKFTQGDSYGQETKEVFGAQPGRARIPGDYQSTYYRQKLANDAATLRARDNDPPRSRWRTWAARIRSFVFNERTRGGS